MTTYKHIVQVHPVENGEPNLYKVKKEFEYDTEDEAKESVSFWNQTFSDTLAVYRGRVNDATGELE